MSEYNNMFESSKMFIGLIVIFLLLIVSMMFLSSFQSRLVASGIMDSTTTVGLSKSVYLLPKAIDFGMFFLVLFYFLVNVYIAYQQQAETIQLVVSWLMLFIAVVTSVGIHNLADKILNYTLFSTYVTQLIFLPYILNHIPILVTIYGITVLIAMYAGANK